LPFTNTVGVEFTFFFAPSAAMLFTQPKKPPSLTHFLNESEVNPTVAPSPTRLSLLHKPEFSVVD
jgi:hypothetical protein